MDTANFFFFWQNIVRENRNILNANSSEDYRFLPVAWETNDFYSSHYSDMQYTLKSSIAVVQHTGRLDYANITSTMLF